MIGKFSNINGHTRVEIIRKMAAELKYTPELSLQILDLYSTGLSIRQIQKMPGMPSRQTISQWRDRFPEFGELYMRAVDDHVESLVDKAMEIADTTKDPKKAKLQIDFRMWLASKLKRDKYGDKLDISHTITIDIAPSLQKAMSRLASVRSNPVIDVIPKQLQSSPHDLME